MVYFTGCRALCLCAGFGIAIKLMAGIYPYVSPADDFLRKITIKIAEGIDICCGLSHT
jgi:hypothetical protein